MLDRHDLAAFSVYLSRYTSIDNIMSWMITLKISENKPYPKKNRYGLFLCGFMHLGDLVVIGKSTEASFSQCQLPGSKNAVMLLPLAPQCRGKVGGVTLWDD